MGEREGANLQASGQNDMKVIHFAARYGKDQIKIWKCIKKIRDLETPSRWKPWKKGIDIDERDKYGFNILHHAIQNGRWEPLKTEGFLSQGDQTTSAASEIKDRPIIQEIIDLKEFKIGDCDKKDNNTLHLALLHGKPEVCILLYKRINGRKEKEESFLKALKQKNSTGKTPLHIACQKCNMEGLTADYEDVIRTFTKEAKKKKERLLVDQDQDGKTPLDLAIESGSETAVKILLTEGHIPINNTQKGYNAFHHCSRFGNLKVMNTLISYFENNDKERNSQ